MKLRPGMSATAVVTTDRRENSVVIPLQALVLQEEPAAEGAAPAGDDKVGKPKEVQGVFVLENNRVKFTPVQTGITGETDIEVTSGVKASDTIVTGPFSVLRTLKNDTVVKRSEEKPGAKGEPKKG
jgi:HlyD family secretion protein